jgi:hypothetical protein
MGDSVQSSRGRAHSLILLSNEHLQNATDHHRRESQRWKAFFTGDAQAACRCKFFGSKLTPFFHIVKVIVAILRASVKRAIVGRIPFSTQAT